MLPKALLFDMDGTLTAPMLDFPAIKAEMRIGQRPILEALAEMSPGDRCAAETILHRHEERAAAGSALNSGCVELLEWIERRRMGIALITRNSRRSVDIVIKRHGLRIDVLVTRDEGVFKPDPAPLRMACRKLGVAEPHCWMVGDGQYDIEAGCAAGMKTVWLSHGKQRHFAAEPWKVVADLPGLLNLLRSAVSDSAG